MNEIQQALHNKLVQAEASQTAADRVTEFMLGHKSVMDIYAALAAVEVAVYHWTDAHTAKYGVGVRDILYRLVNLEVQGR